MSARNLTWQQVIVAVALLAAVVVSYKVLGELPAGVVLVISSIVNLLLGREPPKPPGNGTGGNGAGGNGLLSVASSLMMLVTFGIGCAAQPTPDDPEAQSLSAMLAKCRAEGRDAGTYAAYDACKSRDGGP